MNKLLILLTIMGLCLTSPLVGAGRADVMYLGGPQEGNSWQQTFTMYNSQTFDYLEIANNEGTSIFEKPGFDNFSDFGWSGQFVGDSAYEASASGPAVAQLQFDIHFTGDSDTGLAFDFKAYNGGEQGNLLEIAHLAWDGGGATGKWTITYTGDHESVVVPLPGAVLLLGGFLGRMAAYTRRRQDLS
ncbi:MAG: hypothetical protein PHW74_09125 [Desulfobacca sp.]|nr:hypothetical protein [Desulfobacca sp.]